MFQITERYLLMFMISLVLDSLPCFTMLVEKDGNEEKL